MRVTSAGQTNNFQVRLLRVWLKRQGVWRLVSHQTTRLPQS